MTKTTTPKAPRLTKAQKLASSASKIVAEPEVAEPEVAEPEVAPKVNDLYVPLTKPKKKVKTVKTGVGAQILQLIADGVLSNKEIVAKVLEDNPLRQTTYACVAWYKSQVAAGKIDLPEAQEEITGEYAEELDENGNVLELDQE